MWEEVEIVTLTQLKSHLRLTGTDEDTDLQLKLDQAHGLVLDYIARLDDDDWTDEMLGWDGETAPKAVQAAILRQAGDLYRFRGDDEDVGANVSGLFLSPRVQQLLLMYRTPSIA